jgi:hypothetical protein
VRTLLSRQTPEPNDRQTGMVENQQGPQGASRASLLAFWLAVAPFHAAIALPSDTSAANAEPNAPVAMIQSATASTAAA